MITIVIPCRNEARVIGACLASLARQSHLPPGHGIQVIVAANACTDTTLAVARRHQPALAHAGFQTRIVDLAQAGKPAALNAADAAATFDPRLYIDADIVLDPALLAQLIPHLCAPTPLFCSGTVRPSRSRSPGVRAYFRVWADLPFARDGVPSVGLYGVSATGRRRWGRFPDIASDDRFARLHFEPAERRQASAGYVWPVPDRFAGLLRVKRRWTEGNDELRERFPALLANEDAANTVAATLPVLLRHPAGAPAFAVVVATARLHAARRADRAGVPWRRGRS